MARTAVVAGTATAVSNRVSRRQARRWGAEDQREYQQEEPAPPPPPAAAAPGPDRTIEQLQELASLKEQGVLTPEEFAQQKSRILAA
jgi:hypothetical protein